MWPFTSKSKAKSDDYRKQRWKQLCKELVPPAGEADTWQGEVLRLIANAEDEANRNGFMNWDEEDDRDMDFYVKTLCDDSTFDGPTKEKIRSCAQRIKKAGGDIKFGLPPMADWHFLHFRAVDWCDAHPDQMPMPNRGGDYVGHD
jgi:hypothetical protein